MACGTRCPGFSDVCPDIRRAMACGARRPGFSDSCLNLRRAIAPGAFSVLAGAPGGRFPAAARPDIRLFSQPDGQILPGFLQSDGQTARGRGQPVPNSPGSGAPRESRQPRFPCRGFTAYRSLPPALAGYGLLAAVCRPRFVGRVCRAAWVRAPAARSADGPPGRCCPPRPRCGRAARCRPHSPCARPAGFCRRAPRADRRAPRRSRAAGRCRG